MRRWLSLPKVIGQGEDEGDFAELRRLHENRPDLEPALHGSARPACAVEQHQHQQSDHGEVQEDAQLRPVAVVDELSGENHPESGEHPVGLPGEVALFLRRTQGGRVHGEHAHAAQDHHQPQQNPVEIGQQPAVKH